MMEAANKNASTTPVQGQLRTHAFSFVIFKKNQTYKGSVEREGGDLERPTEVTQNSSTTTTITSSESQTILILGLKEVILGRGREGTQTKAASGRDERDRCSTTFASLKEGDEEEE